MSVLVFIIFLHAVVLCLDAPKQEDQLENYKHAKDLIYRFAVCCRKGIQYI